MADPGGSSLSGVAGIEVRCRDAIAQLVISGLDDLAAEGIAMLAELKAAQGMSPGSSPRATIVTKLIGFHSRALLAMIEKGVV